MIETMFGCLCFHAHGRSIRVFCKGHIVCSWEPAQVLSPKNRSILMILTTNKWARWVSFLRVKCFKGRDPRSIIYSCRQWVYLWLILGIQGKQGSSLPGVLDVCYDLDSRSISTCCSQRLLIAMKRSRGWSTISVSRLSLENKNRFKQKRKINLYLNK
jgi:hypothetical protein